jgi:hypothetical protein
MSKLFTPAQVGPYRLSHRVVMAPLTRIQQRKPAVFAYTEAGDFPEDIINVEGGAIAHGRPIGATGAMLTTRLIHSMRCDGLKRGIV